MSTICVGKNTRNCVQHFLTVGCLPFVQYMLYFKMSSMYCCSCLVCIVVSCLCVFLSSYVYLLYSVCIALFTLHAGLLARRQYSEGPATGHLDTGFS